jgi:integrase/recombinase XerD
VRIRAGAKGAEECVRAFVEELRTLRSSYSRVERARLVLLRFLSHLRRHGVRDLRAATERHVVSFVGQLAARRLSGNTRAAYLSTVRCFFAYLEDRGAVLLNPAATVALPRVHRLPRAPLSEAEVRRLMSTPPMWTARGKRDRAVLEVLYGTGLRVGECLGLDIDDVDLHQRELKVRTGKGKVGRVVPLVGRAAAAVQVYLQEARLAFVRRPSEQALFLNNEGGRLGILTVSYRLKLYAREARIGRRVHPHLLRHTFATHLLRGGADVRHVQALLGHKEIGTTALYTQLEPTDLKRAVAKSHPRERATRRASRRVPARRAR